MDIPEHKMVDLPIHYVPGLPLLSAAQTHRLTTIAARTSAAHPLPGPVQMILVDDTYVRQLNRCYRGKDAVTDVLAFALGVDSGLDSQTPYGEIYISLDRARFQAEEQDAALIDELARLLVHGLLHLAGHDHGTPEQLSYMESETECLLQEPRT